MKLNAYGITADPLKWTARDQSKNVGVLYHLLQNPFSNSYTEGKRQNGKRNNQQKLELAKK